ncbi:MAG: HAMP domain-containing histidine kinase [Clostridiales Family XIII bacterium]|jgi:signal transduction histidine kinase|nr:HAMP domain-containing histidine kinase [Clostridiales Family XIII bacterium]
MRKNGVIILIFTPLLIVLVLLAGVLLHAVFSSSVSDSMDEASTIFVLSPKEMYDLTFNRSLNPDDLTGYDADDAQSQVAALLRSSMIYAGIALTFAICLFMFLLWRVLRIAEHRRTKALIDGLDNIASEEMAAAYYKDSSLTNAHDKALVAAYARVEELIEENVQDYKRLQFYLSHEQKNNIAILRANPSVSKNDDEMRILDRLSDSIEDVITLSDTDSSTDAGIDSSLEVVDVSLICAEACDAYRNLAQISFDFDEDGDYDILAKERWIYRAVSNLLDNAIKYGLGSSIEVVVRSMNHSVVVSVHDHGVGISQDKLDKIFSHRYRVRELNRDGYGIGLSLVSHVCDQAGGFAYVESSEATGTTFYLSFPHFL